MKRLVPQLDPCKASGARSVQDFEGNFRTWSDDKPLLQGQYVPLFLELIG